MMFAVVNKSERPPLDDDLKNSPLGRLICDCWVFKPEERPTFGEIKERLRRTESLLAGGGGSDSGLPARTTPHPPPHPQSLPLRKVSS